MSELRLFPLHTVLFPGMQLPLQVFEPRYRQLVSECLSEGEPFGVVLIKDGPEVGGTPEPYMVGTTAVLDSVLPIDGTRLRVESHGEQRFRIGTLHQDRAYLWAEVSYPVDEVRDVPPALMEQATEGYRQLLRLRDTMESRYTREPLIPSSPGALADAIASAATPVAPQDRMQALLETLDVRRRLEGAVELRGGLVELAHQQTREVIAQRWASVERRN